MQAADLRDLSARARAAGAVYVVDPTVAGLGNAGGALALADALIVSLTKFAASGGDVMAGAIALNPASAHCAALAARLMPRAGRGAGGGGEGSEGGAGGEGGAGAPATRWQRIYSRDLLQLALEARDTDAVVAGLNARTAAVAACLAGRSRRAGGGVLAVHWALSAKTAEFFGAGCMVTLELEGTGEADGFAGAEAAARAAAEAAEAARGCDEEDDESLSDGTRDSPAQRAAHARRERVLAAFYDGLGIAKGPSFGCRFTIMSPFVYLAHYQLVRCAAGRRRLYARGLNPYLVRISVGLEPEADTIAEIVRGLARAAAELGRQRAEA
jgi:cystathionine gamma-synthase